MAQQPLRAGGTVWQGRGVGGLIRTHSYDNFVNYNFSSPLRVDDVMLLNRDPPQMNEC
jgi:hypothetical protein